MVAGECAWDVCVCISYSGDGGQLGSSFLWKGERVGVGRASVEKFRGQVINKVTDRCDV